MTGPQETEERSADGKTLILPAIPAGHDAPDATDLPVKLRRDDLRGAEQACLDLLDTLPVYMRVTDAHGGGETEIGRDDIERLREDGELLPYLTESREAWLRFEDGTSVTIRAHGLD